MPVLNFVNLLISKGVVQSESENTDWSKPKLPKNSGYLASAFVRGFLVYLVFWWFFFFAGGGCFGFGFIFLFCFCF